MECDVLILQEDVTLMKVGGGGGEPTENGV